MAWFMWSGEWRKVDPIATDDNCPALRRQLSNLARRFVTDSHGAEIAEAAAVLPLMFMILLGIFWFGQAFNIYGAITRAAEVGARAGAAPYCSSCSNANTLGEFEANAVSAVQACLLSEHLNPALIPTYGTPPTFNSCISGTTTAPGCSGASSNICVQVPVQLTSTVTSGPVAGAAGVCGISVSFEYPFQFWLPFTSLNKQQIWLPAAARVRMETH